MILVCAYVQLCSLWYYSYTYTILSVYTWFYLRIFSCSVPVEITLTEATLTQNPPQTGRASQNRQLILCFLCGCFHRHTLSSKLYSIFYKRYTSGWCEIDKAKRGWAVFNTIFLLQVIHFWFQPSDSCNEALHSQVICHPTYKTLYPMQHNTTHLVILRKHTGILHVFLSFLFLIHHSVFVWLYKPLQFELGWNRWSSEEEFCSTSLTQRNIKRDWYILAYIWGHARLSKVLKRNQLQKITLGTNESTNIEGSWACTSLIGLYITTNTIYPIWSLLQTMSSW